MLAMPSPRKIVRQSVTVCRRTGMTRQQALETIVKICESVSVSIGGESIALQEWIYDVRLVAVTALGRPPAETVEDWRA